MPTLRMPLFCSTRTRTARRHAVVRDAQQRRRHSLEPRRRHAVRQSAPQRPSNIASTSMRRPSRKSFVVDGT